MPNRSAESTLIELKLLVLSIVVLMLVASCASKAPTVAAQSQTPQKVRSIAIAPGGGFLADAVALDLSKMGFKVIDAVATSNLMVTFDLDEVEIAKPGGLVRLRDHGVDAFLVVRVTGNYDHKPMGASARLTSTRDGQLLADVSWFNEFGHVRKGRSEAASEIAAALAERVR